MKESVEMYEATKQWQPNRYMQQFVRDGIIYFLMYVTPFPPSPTHWDQHNSRVPTQKLTTCYFPRTTRHALYNINVALLENNLTISSTSMLFLTTFCYNNLSHDAPVHHPRARAV